ncbi:MAG TPA: hypothetical protein PLF13_08040 [candidate division Zixibacteria bacterium]|nr:hypothetical protein [candidate division Zixibacteria bacterium]
MFLTLTRLMAVAVLIGITVLACGGCGDDNPVEPTKATGLTAINGFYYKGEMGDTLLSPSLDFAVLDNDSKRIADKWIFFELLEGDGNLLLDSGKTNSSGVLHNTYDFSGELGRATVRAIVKNLDTVDVILRANMLNPGTHGQGQYILVDDSYAMVTAFNGTPVSLDTVADFEEVMVANYEKTLGVVFVIYDTNLDHVIGATSPVFSILVVDSVYEQPDGSMSARYEGTTADGIGIGSRYIPFNFGNNIWGIYGAADESGFDEEEPPSVWFQYSDENLTFWCHQADSSAFQVDIAEPFDWDLYPASVSQKRDDRSQALLKAVRNKYLH